jgi:hypothetical protein
MGETLTQQRRVSDEGLRVVKLFRLGRRGIQLISEYFDGTKRRSTGKLRASSRGNTKGASVVRNYWA